LVLVVVEVKLLTEGILEEKRLGRILFVIVVVVVVTATCI
jgi:hypothetical protein